MQNLLTSSIPRHLQTFNSLQQVQRLSTNHFNFNSVRYFSFIRVDKSIVFQRMGDKETRRHKEQTRPKRNNVGRQPS